MALTPTMKLNILLSVRDRVVSPSGGVHSEFPNVDYVKNTPWASLPALNTDPANGDPHGRDLFPLVGQVLYEDTRNRLNQSGTFETAVRQDAPVLTRSIERLGSDPWIEPPHPPRLWLVNALA